MDETMPAVRVHLASSDVTLASPARKPSYKSVFRTVVLTADDPVQAILPESDNREVAHVQALDNDVVLGPDVSTVSAKGNTATGTPYPSGALIPHANTQPFPIRENGVVYAGATTTNTDSRITVIAVYRR